MVELLREAVATNRVIVLMVYGQVFFVMGLAIALQSSRHSRLGIARSLKWLAAFGILHGLHEWGHLFIPIQAEYMPHQAVELLVLAQTAFLATSYACLFQFGVELLKPLPPRWRLLNLVPGTALAAWIFFAVGPSVDLARDVHDWHRMNSILARYLLCLPGALLAAYGLLRRTREIDVQLSVPRISRPLRIGAYALVGYAFFSGVIVPAGGLFPASRLNDERFYEVFVLPVELYRSVMGAILAIAVIRGMEVFRVELDRLIFNMERDNVQARERERIGRDLHDHTLQKIYGAGLMLRSAEQGQPPESVTGRQIAQGLSLLDEAVSDIRGHIGERAPPGTQCTLAGGLEALGADARDGAPVEIDVAHNLPADCGLEVDAVTHLLAIAREAVSNATRHAGASRVDVLAQSEPPALWLQIADDGTGLPDDLVPGFGLRNMRDRARIIGADIDITDREGGGTLVAITYMRGAEDGP